MKILLCRGIAWGRTLPGSAEGTNSISRTTPLDPGGNIGPYKQQPICEMYVSKCGEHCGEGTMALYETRKKNTPPIRSHRIPFGKIKHSQIYTFMYMFLVPSKSF